MTSPDLKNGPEQSTAQARLSQHTSDPAFDGGLLYRWTYDVRFDDALAFLHLKREPTPQAKRALAVWFFAGGALIALLPKSLTGAFGSSRYTLTLLATVALQFAVFHLARDLSRRLKARRIFPHPFPAVFEEWVDCIAITDLDCTGEVYLSHELIGPVLQTPQHIFVTSGTTTLIIPSRAFADLDEMTTVAQHLRNLSQPPYYFDPPLDEIPAAP